MISSVINHFVKKEKVIIKDKKRITAAEVFLLPGGELVSLGGEGVRQISKVLVTPVSSFPIFCQTTNSNSLEVSGRALNPAVQRPPEKY